MSAQPCLPDGKAGNVVLLKTPSRYSPRKKPIRGKAERKFSDAGHWDKLAGTYLASYDLPAWDVPATPKALTLWIERMDLSMSDFLKTGNYRDVKEAVTLNNGWPLRALIGLALEAKAEGAA